MRIKANTSTKILTVDRLFGAAKTACICSSLIALAACAPQSGITVNSAELPEQGQLTFLERKAEKPADGSSAMADPRLQTMNASRWSQLSSEKQKALEQQAIRLQTETSSDGRYQIPKSYYLAKPDLLTASRSNPVFNPVPTTDQKAVEELAGALARPKELSLPGALPGMLPGAQPAAKQQSAASLEPAIHPALENAPAGFRQPQRTKNEILTWKYGLVPLAFEKAVPAELKAKVLALGQEWSRGTANLVRFAERKDEEFYVQVKLLPSAKILKDSKGQPIKQKVYCKASLGRSPEKVALLSVHGSCSSADLTQKLGHLLGLDYEHKRPDRNKHILVHFDNVIPSEMALYASNDQDLYRPFDVTSIMMLNPFEHSIDKSKPTMSSFGQTLDYANLIISWGDVASVVALYAEEANTNPR